MRLPKGIIPFIFVTLTGQSIAASYSLPDDSGWYQLQSRTTYETVCQTGDPQPCDVTPGSYVLLNHNASDEIGQPVKTTVEIEQEQVSTGALNFQILTKTCSNETNCRFDCPVNDVNFRQSKLLSGHCTAIDEQFQYLPTSFSLKLERLPNASYCSTNVAARITIQITCIE